MFKKKFIIIIFLCVIVIWAKSDRETIYESFLEKIPRDKVVTIMEFKGNNANNFTKELMSFLINNNFIVVDYEMHKMVLNENLKYSEPVFDNKYSDNMPNLVSPDIAIFGSTNRQKSNFLFKQKEHLEYEINLIEIATGYIIFSYHDRIVAKQNIPILLLIISILLILAVSRGIIYLKRGYNVQYVIVAAMVLITLIIVWYFV